jgi:hypothetical protein
MHLNNPAGSSSNLSGADLLAVIAAALRLLTPPGSRSGVRRKADHEQAGIGEPPPSLDARRSFVRLAASTLISKSAWRFFCVAWRLFSKSGVIKFVWFPRDAS